jgi:hypothetical protein
LKREREGKERKEGRKRRKREEKGERCIGFETRYEVVFVKNYMKKFLSKTTVPLVGSEEGVW